MQGPPHCHKRHLRSPLCSSCSRPLDRTAPAYRRCQHTRRRDFRMSTLQSLLIKKIFAGQSARARSPQLPPTKRPQDQRLTAKAPAAGLHLVPCRHHKKRQPLSQERMARTTFALSCPQQNTRRSYNTPRPSVVSCLGPPRWNVHHTFDSVSLRQELLSLPRGRLCRGG